jgi:hypothetical protein
LLELFLTLQRTDEVENSHLLEEPVAGAPIVGAVLFGEGEGGSTRVTFRLSYLLPSKLGVGVGCCPGRPSEGAGSVHLHGMHGDYAVHVRAHARTHHAEVLHEFAGKVAVYGDLDRKLQVCSASMPGLLPAHV